MILLEQGQLSAESCLSHIVDTPAQMEHEADHAEAFLRHLLDQIRSRSCNAKRRQYATITDLVYRKGNLLEMKNPTTAQGVALWKIAVEARQRLLDMDGQCTEAETMGRNVGSEDGVS